MQWCAQRGGGEGQEMSTFVGHSREMSHLPAPYTSNQTPFREIEKNMGPHFQCAVHPTAQMKY